jgi:uncharacterized membrane protein
VRRLWWPPAIGLLLCGLGLGIAGYLTYEHYTGSTSLSCPAGGSTFIDCLGVTTSVYSKIHGVPVAVLGLVFFAIMAVLQSPPAWRSGFWGIRIGRIVWSLVGVATALKLVYDELFRLDSICLWCTSVHVISLLLFILTVFGTAATAPVPAEPGEELGEERETSPKSELIALTPR